MGTLLRESETYVSSWGSHLRREHWRPGATATPKPHPCVLALHRLHLFQQLLWVLGLLAGLLFLLLGLGACYAWRWVWS